MKSFLIQLVFVFILLPLSLNGQTKEESYYEAIDAFNSENYSTAIIHFNKVINAKYEEFLAVSYNYRGLCKKHMGELKAAKRDFLKGIEVQHENLYLHNNLANVYYNEGNYETAIEHFSIALSFNPYNSTICTNLANAYFQLEMYNTAKKYYLKALEANPNNEVALYGVEQVDHLQKIYGKPVYRPINDQLNDVQDMGEHL